jgi:hypothetical protein
MVNECGNSNKKSSEQLILPNISTSRKFQLFDASTFTNINFETKTEEKQGCLTNRQMNQQNNRNHLLKISLNKRQNRVLNNDN